MDLRLRASWDSNHVLQIQNSFQDDIQPLCAHESIILKLIFLKKRKMKGHISNSGLRPYSPDVSTQLPLYPLPWDSVLRKIGWLWFALYPFLFHRFQSKWPQPVCLDQADCLKLLHTSTPASLMRDWQFLRRLRCSVRAPKPECLRVNLSLWDLEHIINLPTVLTFKRSCSQILAPHQPSQTNPFFLLMRTQPHSVR